MLDLDHLEIVRTYLRNAAPEEVYAWLRDHVGEPKKRYRSPYPAELMDDLVKRNDPIIELALAQFTDNPKLLRPLYLCEDPGTRLGVLSNRCRDPARSKNADRSSPAALSLVAFLRCRLDRRGSTVTSRRGWRPSTA